MSDKNKQNIEVKKINVEKKAAELPPKTELLDSSLIRNIFVAAFIYFISYSIFSLFFGNAFGSFIATPLSAVSFFLISRWDRLRESKEISFQNVKDLIRLPKISIKILLLSIISIFFVQIIAGFLTARFENSDYVPKSYSNFMENIEKSSFLMVAVILWVYISYYFGGYLSAKLAIRKALSPYIHAILSSLGFCLLSASVTILIIFLETGELVFLHNHEETSVGANVLFFSQFIFLPLIGAKIAVITSKSKIIEEARKIEDEEKAKEEFTKIVALEVERLKPKAVKNPKVTTKTKKKISS